MRETVLLSSFSRGKSTERHKRQVLFRKELAQACEEVPRCGLSWSEEEFQDAGLFRL